MSEAAAGAGDAVGSTAPAAAGTIGESASGSAPAAASGGQDSSPVASLPVAATAPAVRLWVAGDSLADVGTFGLKATVQRASDLAAGYPVYPEIVARNLGAGSLCSHFASLDRRSFTNGSGCTSFAVGGTAIVNPITQGGRAVPLSLHFQLEAAVAIKGGTWEASDFILVDAGGNDIGGLAETYLESRRGGFRDDATFFAFLLQQLDVGTVTRTLLHSNGPENAAGLYMQRLARTYWDTVKAHTLDRGATRVALFDLPDISLVPRFRHRIAALAAAEGVAVANEFETALRGWVAAFNAELARFAAGEPRVVVVRYFDDLTAQIANPAAFGLTNVTDPACPPVGDFPACTDAALDANPPAGLAAGWWHTWAFSDEFHPSPRGHELLALAVDRAITQAGWR